MFKIQLKTGWRNLKRYTLFSIIKILGLSIGLSICMLILLYAKDEISFDQFHQNKSELYRIVQTWNFADEPQRILPTTSAVLAEDFAKSIPEVKKAVRLNGMQVTIRHGENVFTENPLFVDDNFFSVFSFPIIKGTARNVFQNTHEAVVTEDLALKYFGSQDVVGKILQVKLYEDFENFTITAVARSTPQNSSIKFNILLPFAYYKKYIDYGWIGGSLNTFVLLAPKSDLSAVVSKMQLQFDKKTEEEIAKAKQEKGIIIKIKLGLQRLTDIHLSQEAGPVNGMTDGSSATYSYILTCIAIFILIMASINFINLSIAGFLNRSKEIGVRKVVGGTRWELAKQFMVESFLVTSISFLFAIYVTITVLPYFNELANKKLSFSYLSDVYLYAGFFFLLLLTSFLAGIYPSFKLSAFHPVKVLYRREKISGNNYFTKGLVVLQFSLTIFLIIGTIAVHNQLRFLFHSPLGYDSKNLVRIELPFSNSINQSVTLIKQQLSKNPGVLSVASSGGGRNQTGVKSEGRLLNVEFNHIDDGYVSTFDIPIVAGRNFSAQYPSDSNNSVIVNQTFVRDAGWNAQEAIGKSLTLLNDDRKVKVIGVMKDYHFASLKERITPQLFSMEPRKRFGQIWVKLRSENIAATLGYLQQTSRQIIPYFPYSYQFIEDINTNYYVTETKWQKIITISAVLFVLISCMGLFGLVILSIEQRTKEISIRKVMGAATASIVMLISRQFLALVGISFIVAAPAAYYFVNKWLQDFAYRMQISLWMFVLGGLCVFAIVFLTMSVRTVKAALANPARNLRNE